MPIAADVVFVIIIFFGFFVDGTVAVAINMETLTWSASGESAVGL